ncbi:MAG TPA: hypothetical protein VK749_13005, partial [Xanthobacteraceae bacterium]|nr:hypothetical protein [Xanthobacteraceae bacterium]
RMQLRSGLSGHRIRFEAFPAPFLAQDLRTFLIDFGVRISFQPPGNPPSPLSTGPPQCGK